jgi:hypothetical protein
MTFTYNLAAPDDVTRVRYHIGDTVEATAIFSDEEITFAIDEEGTWQKAVIASIRSVMARIAGEPDMTADWLKVDWRRSSDNWQMLLTEKKNQFGLGATASSGGRHAYRPDSLQKSTPDYGEE